MNRQRSGGSEVLPKLEMRAWKMRTTAAGRQKLTTTNWKQSLKLILSQLYKKLPRTQCADHSIVVWHLKQTGKVNKLDKWMPHELSENQKNHHFWSVISHILCNNSKPFLNQSVTCNEKWIVCDNQWPSAQWLDKKQLQALPKAKLAQEVTLTVVVCYPSDPPQLSEQLVKNHYIMRSMLSK